MSRARIPTPAGTIFGHLTVIVEADPIPREFPLAPARMLLVRCDCGNERVVRLDNLRSGQTVSCGCVRIARLALGRLPQRAS